MKKIVFVIFLSAFSMDYALDYSNYDLSYDSQESFPEQSVYTNSYYGTPSLGIGRPSDIPLTSNQQATDPYATPAYPYTEEDIIE